MSGGSLKTKIWVQALVRRSGQLGTYATVVRSGAPEAGAILVKITQPGGCMVLTQVRTAEGDPAWMWGAGPEPVPESQADAYITRQIGYDEDLWVVEIEAPTAAFRPADYPMFDRVLVN